MTMNGRSFQSPTSKIVTMLGAPESRAADSASRVKRADTGTLYVITGHGWSHGGSLRQYAAYGFALHSWPYDQILAHYFAPTSLSPTPVGRARVLLADAKAALTVASAGPYRVND